MRFLQRFLALTIIYTFINFSLNICQPRVSVIASVYKSDQFISSFLENVTQQTIFDECELILIKSNVPGDEDSVIKKYTDRYPNISYYKLSQDVGLYCIMNLGAQLAKSDLIMRANLDDVMDPRFLEVHARELENNCDIDLVYSGYSVTEKPNETCKRNSAKTVVNPDEFSKEKMCNYLPGPQPMWRKSMHERYGFFDANLKFVGAWQMWLRAVSFGSKFKKIPGNYLLHYINPDGLFYKSANSDLCKKEIEQVSRTFSYMWNPSTHSSTRSMLAQNSLRTNGGGDEIVSQQPMMVKDKSFVIVIPSYNNKYWFQRNLDSVFNQNYKNFRIIYVDDASTDKTGELVEDYIKECGQENKVTLIKNKERLGSPVGNIYKAVSMCQPNEIVVDLDGDDWLADENVLTKLNEVYQDSNVWLTYGQFICYPANYVGWCRELPQEIIEQNEFRNYPWVTTHLRTFYASLFHKIKVEDLLYEGKFFPMAGDLAFMFPLLEMAGKHIKFIPDILYIYNRGSELNEERVNENFQTNLGIHARTLKKYQPLEHLVKDNDKNVARKKAYIKPTPQSQLFLVNDPIYNRDDCLRPFYELKLEFERLGYDLIQTESLENLDDASIIITQDVPVNDLKTLSKYPKEKLFLYMWEPPSVFDYNFEKKYHDYYSKIITWADDLVDNKKYFKYHYPYKSKMIDDIVSFDNKKLCTMIASNKHSSYKDELYSEKRKIVDFFEKLNSNDFEFYGMLWDKSQYRNFKGYTKNKLDCLKNYKFCICYENTKNSNGYITEKIFDCFKSGSVPVYWGAPNIEQYIPKNCFIDRRDFSNDVELYIYMKAMTREKYLTYINNIRKYLESEKSDLYSIKNFVNVVTSVCLNK